MSLPHDDVGTTGGDDTCTLLPAQELYVITKVELNRLQHPDSDHYFDAFLGSLFFAIGLLPSAWVAVSHLTQQKAPTFPELLELFLLTVMLTSAVCFWIFFRKQLRSTAALVGEIESRPKYSIQYSELAKYLKGCQSD